MIFCVPGAPGGLSFFFVLGNTEFSGRHTGCSESCFHPGAILGVGAPGGLSFSIILGNTENSGRYTGFLESCFRSGAILGVGRCHFLR